MGRDDTFSIMLKYPSEFFIEWLRSDYYNIKSLFLRYVKKCEVTTFPTGGDHSDYWDLPAPGRTKRRKEVFLNAAINNICNPVNL